MSVIAATLTSHAEVIGDGDISGLDEFTSLLTENDARLLVDLLKLAVADRVEDEQAKEVLSTVLISKNCNVVIKYKFHCLEHKKFVELPLFLILNILSQVMNITEFKTIVLQVYVIFLAMGSANSTIGAMLLELCVTELEDTTNSTQTMSSTPHPVVQESSHPYVDDVTLRGMFRSNCCFGFVFLLMSYRCDVFFFFSVGTRLISDS